MSRPSRTLTSCLLLLALALPGCSDDGASPSVKPFALELTIQDPLGQPVEGLEAKLHVPIPGFPISAAKPMTTVQFSVPVAAHVNLSVYDLEGQLARTLWDAPVNAGVLTVAVAGGNDPDFLLGSRIYRYEMVAAVDSVETFRDSKYMSLYTSIDVDQRPVLGVSDREGIIRFTDRTHFPFLYGLGPQPWVDENGDPAGTFEFDDVASVRLYDPIGGVYINYDVPVSEGRNAQVLVWDAAKARPEADWRGAAVAAVGPAPGRGEGAAMTAGAAVPVLEYRLWQNSPNPFN